MNIFHAQLVLIINFSRIGMETYLTFSSYFAKTTIFSYQSNFSAVYLAPPGDPSNHPPTYGTTVLPPFFFFTSIEGCERRAERRWPEFFESLDFLPLASVISAAFQFNAFHPKVPRMMMGRKWTSRLECDRLSQLVHGMRAQHVECVRSIFVGISAN